MTFTKYLEEQFFKDYHGDKEHFEAAFDNWLSNLDTGEVMAYAEHWGKQLLKGEL